VFAKANPAGTVIAVEFPSSSAGRNVVLTPAVAPSSMNGRVSEESAGEKTIQSIAT